MRIPIIRNIIVFLLFWTIGLLLYVPALDSVFTLDDFHQIFQNPSLRSVTTIPSLFTDKSTASRGPEGIHHYRPLLLATFALNYRMGGVDPKGYHLVNLAFHVGSAFLVFLIFLEVFGWKSVGLSHSGDFLGALAAGLILLAHPLNAEVINYVTARSSVMATFFYLLAFYAYVRYRPPSIDGHRFENTSVQQKETIPRMPCYGTRHWLWISLGSFALGMLTKEILLTLPVMLVLYEGVFIPGGKRTWREILRHGALYLGILLVYLTIRGLFLGAASVPQSLWPRGFWNHLLLQIKALAMTWQLMVFPAHLSFIHDVEKVRSLGDIGVIVSALLLAGGVGIMVTGLRSQRRDWRMIGFFLVWFYISLLPTTVIHLNAVLQENRTYIASVSFAVIGGILLARIGTAHRAVARPIAWGLLGSILITYGWGVQERNHVWSNEITLWQDTLNKNPHSFLAHMGLGSAYVRSSSWSLAEEQCRRALEVMPRSPDMYSNLGWVHYKMNRFDQAEKEYRIAIALDPNHEIAHSNLALLYWKENRNSLAIQEYQKTLLINPANELAIVDLGTIFQQQQQDDFAKILYEESLRQHPNLAPVWVELGLLYKRLGNHLLAIQAFHQGVRLSPSLEDGYFHLGEEYLIVQKPKEAIEAFKSVLALRPEDGFGYLTLGKLYEQEGQLDKAQQLYRKVLHLDPGVGRNRTAISLANQELNQLHHP